VVSRVREFVFPLGIVVIYLIIEINSQSLGDLFFDKFFHFLPKVSSSKNNNNYNKNFSKIILLIFFMIF